MWPKFLSEQEQQGQLDWEETLADSSFAWAKKGAQALERAKVARVNDDGRWPGSPYRC
ncbi:MAG: hypothetical protein QGH37_13530 [Candidatus Poribacteria bacterium]|nr:hypothetical protein [Candidatus Poribacteria bacterium]MDP6998361.1 hypothetical protein [Candidatus Poribacteria bacterium]